MLTQTLPHELHRRGAKRRDDFVLIQQGSMRGRFGAGCAKWKQVGEWKLSVEIVRMTR